MTKLSSLFKKTMETLETLKQQDAVWYKGLNVGDLLVAEIMANQLNKKKDGPGLFFKVKNVIKSKKDRYALSFKEKLPDNYMLVFVNETSQWNNIYPVVLDLEKQHIKVVVLSTKPKLVNKLIGSGISAGLIKGFSYKISEWLKPNVSKDGPLATIQYYLPQVRFLEKYITKLFLAKRPNYVLIGNDNTFEGRLFASLAKNHHIPTGMIQHGALDRINPLNGRILVDQIFVYGQKASLELEHLGIPTSKIIISGWPQKGQQINQNDESPFSFFKDFVVTTFSGHGHSVSKEHHFLIIENLKKLQQELNLNMCIKLHAKDDKSNYVGFDPKKTLILTNDDLIDQNISFYGLLAQASIVITGASTSVLDALLIGTPVVSLDLLNEYGDVGFIKDGLTFHASNYDTFKQHVKHLLDLKSNGTADILGEKKALIEKYYYKFYDKNYAPEESISKEICLKAGLN